MPDDFTEKELQTGMWWRHLVAGGLAGGLAGGSAGRWVGPWVWPVIRPVIGGGQVLVVGGGGRVVVVRGCWLGGFRGLPLALFMKL